MATAFEVAQRAEIMAAAAQTRIESHERECARRYTESGKQFDSLQDKLSEMQEAGNKRFRAQVGGILTILGMGLIQVLLKLMHVG